MESYKRPEIIRMDEMAEGIFAASGSDGTGGGGQKCESIYMNGVFTVGNGNSINDGYKIGYGCDGCPAIEKGKGKNSYCNIANITWEGDFRPWWEKQGKTGDEKGW